jgi:flagellar hook-associated protein 3 FlgL
MRVADSTLSQQVVTTLRRCRQEMAELQVQLASGRRFSRPSELPRAAARALMLHNDLDTLERYRASVDYAGSRLAVVEAALGTLTELLQDCLELALAGANGSLTADDRLRLAAEAEQILEGTLELANSSWTGRYLFAGHRTSTPAFERVSLPEGYAFVYQGDQGKLEREVAPGQVALLNLPGDAVFLHPLEAIEELRRGLAANDQQAITQALASLHSALEQCLHHRAALGVRVSHLELRGNRLQDLTHACREALAREEDVDFALAASALRAREIAYQSSLAVGARLLQASLLDHLR